MSLLNNVEKQLEKEGLKKAIGWSALNIRFDGTRAFFNIPEGITTDDLASRKVVLVYIWMRKSCRKGAAFCGVKKDD